MIITETFTNTYEIPEDVIQEYFGYFDDPKEGDFKDFMEWLYDNFYMDDFFIDIVSGKIEGESAFNNIINKLSKND